MPVRQVLRRRICSASSKTLASAVSARDRSASAQTVSDCRVGRHCQLDVFPMTSPSCPTRRMADFYPKSAISPSVASLTTPTPAHRWFGFGTTLPEGTTTATPPFRISLASWAAYSWSQSRPAVEIRSRGSVRPSGSPDRRSLSVSTKRCRSA